MSRGREERELRRDNNCPTWFSEILAHRRALLNQDLRRDAASIRSQPSSGLAEKLLAERPPFTDLAYLSGFSSQSHLTTAMKKYRNLTRAPIT